MYVHTFPFADRATYIAARNEAKFVPAIYYTCQFIFILSPVKTEQMQNILTTTGHLQLRENTGTLHA